MTDHQQAAIEAVKAELDSQEAMHCTRVWEAWRYGTMTEEDFVNVSEDDECVQALVAAAEPHLRRKWAEALVERIGASNLGAPLHIYPDATAHIASGPEMRALLCKFIMEGTEE